MTYDQLVRVLDQVGAIEGHDYHLAVDKKKLLIAYTQSQKASLTPENCADLMQRMKGDEKYKSTERDQRKILQGRLVAENKLTINHLVAMSAVLVDENEQLDLLRLWAKNKAGSWMVMSCRKSWQTILNRTGKIDLL